MRTPISHNTETSTTQISYSPDLGTVSIEEAFILRNSRRRGLLSHISGYEESYSLLDAARQVAAWEYDKPISELEDKETKSVRNAIYKSHIPPMEEKGLLEYDRDSREIYPDTSINSLTPFIEDEPCPESLFEGLDDFEGHILTRDDGFNILSERRRRDAINILDIEGELKLRTLAENVTAHETGEEVEKIDRNHYKTVYSSLYQTHLPKLETAEIVETQRDNISKGRYFNALTPYI